ncbi:MAG: hypothetical protein ACKOKG_04860, partial [Verrucomicrobiota bacterium]
MNSSTLRIAILSCCLSTPGFVAPAVADANWPAWRGPLANGVAPDAHPPTRWSETNHVQWKVPIPGRGTSTPIIWGDQVFVLTAIPTGPEAASEESGAAAAAPDRSDRPDRPRRGGGPGGGRGGPGGGGG